MSLEQHILDAIASQQQDQRDQIARLGFIRNLVEEVMPHLPHTLGQYFTINDVWTGYDMPPERSKYTLRFQTHEGLADEDVSQAFGTIVKVAAGLLRLGWKVEPQPQIEAAASYLLKEGQRALDVEVKAIRQTTRLHVAFLHLPESERCKLVEEQVLVPERYERKLKVVCEGEPISLVDSPPPMIEAQS